MIETLKRIWKYSEKRHKHLKIALLFSFLRSVFGITQLIAIILTVNVLCGNSNAKSSILKIAILTTICIIGNFVTSYFEQINTLKSGFFMVADQRIGIGNHLKSVPLGYFNSISSGKLCASLTSTLTNVETAAAMTMIGIVSGLFNTFSLFLFILFYDWRIGILSGIGMLVYLFIVNKQMKLSREHAPFLQQAQSTLAKSAFSFLQGIKVTKSFSIKTGDQNLKKAVQESCKENIALTSKSMPSQFLSSICIAVFESLILLASLYFYAQTNSMDTVKLVVLLLFSFMVYASLNQAGSMLSMIGLLDSSLEEIDKIKNEKPLPQELPVQIPSSNTIVFDHVHFSYGENQILQDISFSIKPNSFTALIGPSGSGKTTLCQLIARFRDSSSGSITIGGADIRHIPTEDLMRKMSMVFQNVYLFEDSILNNIRFGKPNASLEEVREAARKAHCDDFILSLENGYETILKEGGNSLSGGEKQRISIARAILKDAPIVILDEATSALDAENEQEILDAIDVLTKNKTVLMIAHRMKSVEHADQILALKDGKIVQQGTPEQLKSIPGLYADFIASRKEAKLWEVNR